MRPVVLLVEDSDADVRLTQEAFGELGEPVDLRVAHDGLEALDTLRRGGPHGEALRPQLILLDLNMPRMDGREVLAQLKQDPELRRIPVVVLTTSEDEADVLEVYQLHANCYVTKPIDLDRFFHVVSAIHTFWLGTARLPPA
ncbi:MAG: two-component system response regulator [Myxococcales bacterium]